MILPTSETLLGKRKPEWKWSIRSLPLPRQDLVSPRAKLDSSYSSSSSIPPTLARREGNLIHIDNKHKPDHQPIIPFFVVIILLAIAIIAAVFGTICCWRARKAKAAKEKKKDTEDTDGTRRGDRYEIPTLVFQQHEPETHGYFAPLYLEQAHVRGGAANEEEAKRELRRIWNPGMVERRRSLDDDEVDPKDTSRVRRGSRMDGLV